MYAVNDLNIEKEVLPFFDFTLNSFAQKQVLGLLQTPLSSLAEIKARQAIIKGFIANLEALDNFFYARQDFNEVHSFLTENTLVHFLKGAKLKLLFSERERSAMRAKIIQFVLLFINLENYYSKRIRPDRFPQPYREEVIRLGDFFGSFRLARYEELIREDRLGNKHIVELAKLIAARQTAGEIILFYRRLFEFEALLSVSIGVAKHRFCFPVLTQNGFLLEQVYHPMLKQPVKNDFCTQKNVVLLTGPNMSGKSTFLKAVGLCVYLAHLGIGVPAQKALLPHFDNITISINHNDNISGGLSHFMNEILRLKKVVVSAAANKSCFAVFDELFKGTNVDDALQVSAKTISGLTQFKNSLFFISTHLHQLKEIAPIAGKTVETCYVDCHIANDMPVFNYKIKEGWSDLKVGQMLFAREGLNELLNGCFETAAPRRSK